MRSLMIAIMVLVGGVALAKTPRDPASAEMRAAYEDGMAAYNLGHFDEALEAFEKGYRIKRDPAFLFNIAQCQRSLHHSADAARTYRAYLRESPQIPPEKHAEIEHLADLMEQEAARQLADQPPTGVTAPNETPAATPAPAPAAENVLVQQPPPKKKRTAMWVGISVGVGAVVGLGLGLQHGSARRLRRRT